jgi:hypothetical protein
MTANMRTRSMIGVLAVAALSALPAAAQSPFPSSAQEFSSHFWTEHTMRAIDANRDGMVTRQEFLTYMGAQFDTMDTGRKGMLTGAQFTDRKMMARTFMFPSSPNESGPSR